MQCEKTRYKHLIILLVTNQAITRYREMISSEDGRHNQGPFSRDNPYILCYFERLAVLLRP